MNVLHVDDSREICELYSDMFAKDNHVIKSVNNGREGLDLVLKNNYDLILLDMCMPNYNGLDFLQDLKILRPTELKKVVVVSVLNFNEKQIKELIEFGVHSVEEKPSDFKSIEDIHKRMSLK